MEFSYVKVAGGVIVAAQERVTPANREPGVKMICDALRRAELPHAQTGGLVFRYAAPDEPTLDFVALAATGKRRRETIGVRPAHIFHLGLNCSHGQMNMFRVVAVVGPGGDPRVVQELLDFDPNSWHETKARNGCTSTSNHRHEQTFKMLMSMRPFVAVTDFAVPIARGQEEASLIERVTEKMGADFLSEMEEVFGRQSALAENPSPARTAVGSAILPLRRPRGSYGRSARMNGPGQRF